ncbi:MAG: hypothetical protein ACE5JQ_01525 [Candidatus Methylomirabilales bacterium]
MKREELLKAFAEMSSEDQEAIRVELIRTGASRGAWDPMAMCHDMMEKMKAGVDPMAMCRDMMEKMKAGGDPWAICREKMQPMKENCC